MSDVLCLQGVCKDFVSRRAVDNLSLCVPEHAVFGFVGQNGAGKTTTMRMIVGLLKPGAGEIRVQNERVVFGKTATNRYVGYLPDVPAFYGTMTPKEYLGFCGRIAGLAEPRLGQRIGDLLERTGLASENRRIRTFSRGMKQRLGIAQALLSEPAVLICDEPTSALDPVGRVEVLDLIKQASANSTVVFSTHILSDVERVCDHVAMIDKGRLVLSGPIQTLKEMHRRESVKLVFREGFDVKPLSLELERTANVLGVEVQENELLVAVKGVDQTTASIFHLIASGNLPLVRFEIEEPTLESVFLEALQ
jgi:ABC-2 type transport system ATP-binding protein